MISSTLKPLHRKGYMYCQKAHLQYVSNHKLLVNTTTTSTRVLTNIIVSSVHGVFLQAVPHDVPAHEGV